MRALAPSATACLAAAPPTGCLGQRAAAAPEIRVVQRFATCCPQPFADTAGCSLARFHCMASHHSLLPLAVTAALLLVCDADRQAPAAAASAASSPAEPKLQIEQDKKRLYIKWSETRQISGWIDGVADARRQSRSSVIRITTLTVRFDRRLFAAAAPVLQGCDC